MWIYAQSTGRLYSPDGLKQVIGYSGAGQGKNNPTLEAIRNVGPIPRGMYVIGEAYESKRVGHHAIPLYPHNHTALTRTDFRIHGDSISAPGTASNGCVILSRSCRERISSSTDKLFLVIE